MYWIFSKTTNPVKITNRKVIVKLLLA